MAGSGSYACNSLEPSLRIKQRDFTIPVRLNQLKLLKSRHPRGERSHFKGRMINCPISDNSSDVFLRASTLIRFATILTLLMGPKSCHCDTQADSSSSLRPRQPTTDANHKERLMNHLAESIERQHLSMLPVRGPFAQKRPSKFDSGEEIREILHSLNEQSKSNLTSTSNRKSVTTSAKKADESLRHIMMMHEHVHRQQNHKSNNQPPSDSAKVGLEPGLIGRWREISRTPIRMASNLINPNKIVSQVISYISPLVGVKFAEQSVLKQKFAQNEDKFKAQTSKFVARSSNGISFAGLQIKHGRNLPTNQQLATNSPQISYLRRPDPLRNSHTTEPTTLLDKEGDSPRKSQTLDHLMPTEDLMSEPSEPGLTQIDGAKVDEGESEPKLSASKAGLWLKANANMLAQSYIQNSLRDLITLTQLPILSAKPSSTAPSVLERKGKIRGPQKVNASLTESQGTRVLNELYRYAYILGTSVKRKKDPLKALGSVPSFVWSPSKKNGFHSERPKSHLTQGILNQIENYKGGLAASLQGASSNRARPRGVMWDMATDPSLAVTVFHLLERASVALPLGEFIDFYLELLLLISQSNSNRVSD